LLLMLTIIISPRFTKADETSIREGLSQQLTQLQQQIDLYALEHNGDYPELGRPSLNGWGELISMGYISGPPLNLHVKKSHVQSIKTSPELITADHHINQTDIGWFYNPETGRIVANGFDSNSHSFHDESGYDPKHFAW
jgi:hypothetical protein